MKVAILTGGYPSSDNPSKSIFNKRAVDGLHKHAQVCVFHIRYWKPGRALLTKGKYDGIDTFILALPWIPVNIGWVNALNYRLWQILLQRLLKHDIGSFDVLHTIGMEFAPLGAHLNRKFGVKHVVQTIGSDLLIYLPKIESYFGLKKWVNNTACVICNSNFLEKVVKNRYPQMNSITLYRGTDLTKFKEQVKEEPIQLLFLGGFSNRKGSGFGSDLKGGESLKSIWAQVDERKLNVKLKIGGPNSTSDEQKSWRKGLKNPDAVELLGQLSPHDIPKLLSETHIVLIPSKSEGLPNVAVESLASGCLVIASKVGGIPEIVLENECGILLDPSEHASWVESIVKCIENYSDFGQLTENGRTHVENHFDAEKYPLNLIETYNSI